MKGELIQGSILKIWGRDAKQYLNARLSCEIVPGKLTPGFALDARGLIQSFLRVAEVEDYFLVHFDNTLSLNINLEILFKYKVAEKLQWEILQNHIIVHTFEDLKLGLKLQSKRTQTEGFDYILKSDSMTCPTQPIEDFNLLRVRAGFPIFFEEVPAAIFPFALTNQELIPSKPFCYVGQEAVEKAKSRGRSPYFVLPFEVSELSRSADLNALVGANFNLSHGLEAQILFINERYGWAKLKKLPTKGITYHASFGNILFCLEI